MTRPIHVAHLIATNFYGGPEKQILTHALALNPKIARLTLISFDDGHPNELYELAQQKNVPAILLPACSPFDPRMIGKLTAVLKEKQVDVLCAHGYKANIIGRMGSWMCQIPLLAVSRGWTAENPRIRFYEMLDRLFLRMADHIVAVSAGQQAKLKKRAIGLNKTSMIHNAIDIEATSTVECPENLRALLGIPTGAIIVASAGRLSPEKNQKIMIELASRLCSQHPDLYFVIFGEGALREELSQAIGRAHLENRFFLPGFRRDVQSLMKQIDVFMLPSFTEGLPNVVLEAYAHSKPVVASAVGGTPEVVDHDHSGFLTEPQDIEAMHAALKALIENPALRQTMGSAGHRQIADKFGFPAQTEQYELLYKKLARRRSC